jgi:hypothetical protein
MEEYKKYENKDELYVTIIAYGLTSEKFVENLEQTIDSCNNEFVAYTFSAGDDIIYKKEKREWSSSIMSTDSTQHLNKMRTIVDTLNDFHSDSSVTEKNKKIHIKYNNKVYHTDKNIPLFGKRYYVLDDVTNATPAPLLPASITIN